jgi:hypothetical protein
MGSISAKNTDGRGFFRFRRGGDAWERVLPRESGNVEVDVDQFFEGESPGVVLYGEERNTYYVIGTGVSSEEILRAVLTAPWVARDTNDGTKVTIGIRNASTGIYEETGRVVCRYDLAGRWGQLLRDVGDAACKSGIIIALIDAVVWLRGVWSNSSAASVSPRYVVVGLLLGVFLYALGLLLKYLFDRFYGRTPAAKVVEARV